MNSNKIDKLPRTQAPGSARALLAALQAHYASLPRYGDSGRVLQRLTTGAVHEVRFDTWFERGQHYRFGFARPHPYPPLRHVVSQMAVGLDGDQAYFSSQRGANAERVERTENLRMAVAMATGISGGAAHTLSTLLFPEIGLAWLTGLRRPRLRRTRVVEGVPCHQISARHPRGGRVRLFIGIQDLLLRRLDDARSKSTELRRPQA